MELVPWRLRGRPLGMVGWLVALCLVAGLPVVAFATFSVYRQAEALRTQDHQALHLRSQVVAHGIGLQVLRTSAPPVMADAAMALRQGAASLQATAEQVVPAGWFASLIDEEQQVIATWPQDGPFMQGDLPAATLAALQTNRTDFMTAGLDGQAVRMSASPVPGTPWLVAVGRAVQDRDAAPYREVVMTALQGLSSVGLALLVAGGIARRMARGIRHAAACYKRGEPLAPYRIVVAEVSELFETLTELRQSYVAKSLELHKARRDPVTHLATRPLFLELAAEQIARVEAHADRGLSLLFVDLDNFKQVNDHLGHDAGDRVLHRVAGALVRSVRDLDLVGRYGGDEFVICLEGPRSGIEAVTAQVAARMLSQVAAVGYDIGCSVGWSLHERGAAIDDLIDAADRAMLQAKRAGKNCVVRAIEREEGAFAPAAEAT